MKLMKSFGYALTGIKIAFQEQLNLRIHFFALSVVVGCGWYFSISTTDWCILLLVAALVIGLELVNTSIESLTDLVTKEKHPVAGKVKDIAAGAVLFASIMAVIIGVLIFAKYV